MRPIRTAHLDKARPVVVLTRSAVAAQRPWVTVAAITSTRRGLSTEVPVGPANGLDHDSVINLDDVHTIPAEDLGPVLGWLRADQEPRLAAAVFHAFALDW